MEPYNTTEETSLAASQELLERGQAIVREPIAEAIWANLGFHVAYVRLRAVGKNELPIGPQLQTLIALVLAARESAQGQLLLQAAAEGNADD